MKIKNLRIKINSDNQEFDLKDFFTGSNTIYTTIAQVVKEKDGYYWHAFFTYESKSNYFSILEEDKHTPLAFIDEVNELLKTQPPKKVQTRNAIKSNMARMYGFISIENFSILKGLGKTCIETDQELLTQILQIAHKHQPK